MKTRYQSFAYFSGRLYFPTQGITPMGVFREITPVLVLAATEAALADALRGAFVAPRPIVEEYHRGQPVPKNPVQQAAGCRSWVEFARASLRFGVIEAQHSWQIAAGEGESAVDDHIEELPLSAGPDEIAAACSALASARTVWLDPSSSKRRPARAPRRRTMR